MIRRLSFTTALGAAAAAALMAGAAGTAPVALVSMSSPLATYSHSAAAPPAKKCQGNLTAGTIGGQPTCLGVGQQCQQAHVADYPQFGFTCAKVGNRYQLSSNSKTARTAPARQAPAHPAPVHH